ncbi:MAG: ABC transporter permease subunit [Deltaproteobacteria bacterium]|nr:ABC transporter permease subunit [Deltaproteobacteria bacterium]
MANKSESFAVSTTPPTGIISDRQIVILVSLLIGFILFFFMLFPLYSILKMSFLKNGHFSLASYYKYFRTPRIARSLHHSFYVAIISMIVTTILAFFFAYALTRTTIKGKNIFYTIIMMPLISPPIIQALALILLFGRNGLITAHLLKTDWSIYGAWGIIISEIFYCLPHALVILYTTLSAVDTRIDEAAESLGANAFQVFWKVTVPSAKYGLVSAAALVFNLTITDFGNPIVIGGNYNVLATEIYSQVIGLQKFDMGATISVILLIPSVAAFLVNYYISKKSFSLISGQARPFLRPSRMWKKIGFTGYCILISACIILIYVTVVFGSFVKVWPYDWRLSFTHYNFPSIGGYASLWTSFWIAIVVGIIGASLTLVSGYIVEKAKPKGSQLLYLLSVMPAAIPGTVMGLGYILAFNRPYYIFYGTPWIIIINVVICNYTLGMLSSITNLKQIDKSMEEAATSLGASIITTFTRVVFPLSKVAFMQTFIYYFMRSMVTISAVIFLVSATVHLAAIEIIYLDMDGRMGSANAMATVIMVIVLSFLGVVRFIGKKKFSSPQMQQSSV